MRRLDIIASARRAAGAAVCVSLLAIAIPVLAQTESSLPSATQPVAPFTAAGATGESRGTSESGVVTATDPAPPANFRPQLVTKCLCSHTLRCKLREQLVRSGVVASGDVGEFVVHLGVGSDQVELLRLPFVPQFLHFEAFIDQRTNSLALNVGQVFLAWLNAGGDDQQGHTLDGIVGGDDLAVDRYDDAFRYIT